MSCRCLSAALCSSCCVLVLLTFTACVRQNHTTPPIAKVNSPGRSDGIFRDVAPAAGINFLWGPRDPTKLTIREMMGFGCAFLDYDGDGKLDALLVTSDHVELYRNLDGSRFENVTSRAFPGSSPRPYLMGCAVCDFDGDGRPDIFVTGYGRTILYHNEGGTFKDITQGSGLEARGPYDWTTSAAWSDVDGDGRPDLYVCRYVRFTPEDRQFCTSPGVDGKPVNGACQPTAYSPQKGSLFRNLGNGRFQDITEQAGLADTHGNGLGCRFCDFNADGHPDLYVANDQLPGDLFLGLGHGKFRNIGAESGTALSSNGGTVAGMGIAWGDYDNDGRFDLLVSNFSGQPKLLFHNEGGNLFFDAAPRASIVGASLPVLTFSAEMMDVDDDGLLDIVLFNGEVQSLVALVDPTRSYPERSLLFLNAGKGQFTDGTERAGPDFARKIVGRGAAVGDYDGDGRLDLLVVDAEGLPLLLHNESQVNHSITLRVLAADGKSDALGARVTLTNGSIRQIREVTCGGSYLSSNAPEVHFGLGSAASAELVAVSWPGGGSSSYRGLKSGRAYRVVQSGGAPTVIREFAPSALRGSK